MAVVYDPRLQQLRGQPVHSGRTTSRVITLDDVLSRVAPSKLAQEVAPQPKRNKSLWERALSNPLVNYGLLKPLEVLDFGRAAAVSAFNEGLDLLPDDWSDGTGGDEASFGDWWKQTKERIGFGDVLERHTDWGLNERRAIGFIGDVAFDPVTYLSFGAATAVKKGTMASGRVGREALSARVYKTVMQRAEDGADEAVLAATKKQAAHAAQQTLRGGTAYALKTLTKAEADQIGLLRSGLYMFGKRLPAVRIPKTGLVGDVADGTLTRMRLAFDAWRPGGWLTEKAAPRVMRAERLALQRGDVPAEKFWEGLTRVLAEDSRRAVTVSARREGYSGLEALVKELDLVGNDELRKGLADAIEHNVGSPATIDAGVRVRKFLDVLWDAQDADVKALDPTGGFKKIERGHFPHVATDDAVKFFREGSELAREVADTLSINDPAEFFQPRMLQADKKFFGYKLTVQDLSVKRLNEIANEGGFKGKFFEDDAVIALTKYVDSWAKQRGSFAVVKHLMDNGVAEAWGRKWMTDEGAVKRAANDLAKSVKQYHSTHAKAASAAQKAAAGVVEMYDSALKQLDQVGGDRVRLAAERKARLAPLSASVRAAKEELANATADLQGVPDLIDALKQQGSEIAEGLEREQARLAEKAAQLDSLLEDVIRSVDGITADETLDFFIDPKQAAKEAKDRATQAAQRLSDMEKSQRDLMLFSNWFGEQIDNIIDGRVSYPDWLDDSTKSLYEDVVAATRKELRENTEQRIGSASATPGGFADYLTAEFKRKGSTVHDILGDGFITQNELKQMGPQKFQQNLDKAITDGATGRGAAVPATALLARAEKFYGGVDNMPDGVRAAFGKAKQAALNLAGEERYFRELGKATKSSAHFWRGRARAWGEVFDNVERDYERMIDLLDESYDLDAAVREMSEKIARAEENPEKYGQLWLAEQHRSLDEILEDQAHNKAGIDALSQRRYTPYRNEAIDELPISSADSVASGTDYGNITVSMGELWDMDIMSFDHAANQIESRIVDDYLDYMELTPENVSGAVSAKDAAVAGADSTRVSKLNKKGEVDPRRPLQNRVEAPSKAKAIREMADKRRAWLEKKARKNVPLKARTLDELTGPNAKVFDDKFDEFAAAETRALAKEGQDDVIEWQGLTALADSRARTHVDALQTIEEFRLVSEAAIQWAMTIDAWSAFGMVPPATQLDKIVSGVAKRRADFWGERVLSQERLSEAFDKAEQGRWKFLTESAKKGQSTGTLSPKTYQKAYDIFVADLRAELGGGAVDSLPIYSRDLGKVAVRRTKIGEKVAAGERSAAGKAKLLKKGSYKSLSILSGAEDPFVAPALAEWKRLEENIRRATPGEKKAAQLALRDHTDKVSEWYKAQFPGIPGRIDRRTLKSALQQGQQTSVGITTENELYARIADVRQAVRRRAEHIDRTVSRLGFVANKNGVGVEVLDTGSLFASHPLWGSARLAVHDAGIAHMEKRLRELRGARQKFLPKAAAAQTREGGELLRLRKRAFDLRNKAESMRATDSYTEALYASGRLEFLEGLAVLDGWKITPDDWAKIGFTPPRGWSPQQRKKLAEIINDADQNAEGVWSPNDEGVYRRIQSPDDVHARDVLFVKHPDVGGVQREVAPQGSGSAGNVSYRKIAEERYVPIGEVGSMRTNKVAFTEAEWKSIFIPEKEANAFRADNVGQLRGTEYDASVRKRAWDKLNAMYGMLKSLPSHRQRPWSHVQWARSADVDLVDARRASARRALEQSENGRVLGEYKAIQDELQSLLGVSIVSPKWQLEEIEAQLNLHFADLLKQSTLNELPTSTALFNEWAVATGRGAEVGGRVVPARGVEYDLGPAGAAEQIDDLAAQLKAKVKARPAVEETAAVEQAARSKITSSKAATDAEVAAQRAEVPRLEKVAYAEGYVAGQRKVGDDWVNSEAKKISKEYRSKLKGLDKDMATLKSIGTKAGKRVDKAEESVRKAAVRYDQGLAVSRAEFDLARQQASLTRMTDEIMRVVGGLDLRGVAGQQPISRGDRAALHTSVKKGVDAAEEMERGYKLVSKGEKTKRVALTPSDEAKLETLVEAGSDAAAKLKALELSDAEAVGMGRVFDDLIYAQSLAPDDPLRAVLASASEAQLEMTLARQEVVSSELKLWDASQTGEWVKDVEEGFTTLEQWGLPGIKTSKEVKEVYDNFARIQDPAIARGFEKIFGWFTKRFKAYATATPGFHVRNALSNTFSVLSAGGDPVAMFQATRLYEAWVSARRTGGDAVDNWLNTLDGDTRRLFDEAVKISDAAGGGLQVEAMAGAIAKGQGGRKIDNNWWLRANRRFAERVEGSARFMLAYDSAVKGMDFHTGTARVKRYLFDYSPQGRSDLDLVAGQIIPFWTWMSRNLPLQLVNRWTNPKAYLYYQSFLRNLQMGQEEDPLIPSYLREQGAVQLAGDFLLDPDLPHTRIEQQINQLRTDPRRQLSQVNPLLRLPFELDRDRKLHSNIPFKDDKVELGGGPAQGPLGALLGALGLAEDGPQGQPMVDDRLNYALSQLVPPLAQAERVLPETAPYEQRQLSSVLSFLGVPVRKVTDSDRAGEKRRQERNKRPVGVG